MAASPSSTTPFTSIGASQRNTPIVAGGYGGDMPEDQAYDLLDDIDFYYNKVKCRKIEKLLPVLSKLVIEEQKFL